MIRIRFYFSLMAFRHLALAAVVYASHDTLTDTPALHYMVDAAPLTWWAAAMTTVGVLCIGGMIWPREIPGRPVVVASVALTAAIAATLGLAVALDPEATGVLAVLFATLTGKDVLIVGLRWTDPFERVARAEGVRGD